MTTAFSPTFAAVEGGGTSFVVALSRGSAAPQADARWAQRQYSTIWASLGPQTLRAPAADEKLGVVAETELEADVDFWSPGERGPLAMGMIREDR